MAGAPRKRRVQPPRAHARDMPIGMYMHEGLGSVGRGLGPAPRLRGRRAEGDGAAGTAGVHAGRNRTEVNGTAVPGSGTRERDTGGA